MIGSIICISLLTSISIIVIFCGVADEEPVGCVIGAIFLIVAIMGIFELKTPRLNNSIDTQYIPAEPIAYNSTQTVFTTDKGNIIVNGIYPDGVYILDMDGDTVLVVWQAVDGEEVGLG